MHHLPAYVALERWASGRVAVVVAPDDTEGAERLKASGAQRVVVTGPGAQAGQGLEVLAGFPDIDLPDGSVDLVACIEGYARLASAQRQRVRASAARVLRRGGVFAAWAPHMPDRSAGVDFWTLEAELAGTFDHLYMVAQLPWAGVSMAPVVDAPDSDPAVVLEESLLQAAPDASHYLAIAFRGEPSTFLLKSLKRECLLVPVPAGEDQRVLAEARSRVDELEQELHAVAQRTRDELRDRIAATRAEQEQVEAKLHLAENESSRWRDKALEAQREQAARSARIDAVERERSALLTRSEAAEKKREELQARVEDAERDRVAFRAEADAGEHERVMFRAQAEAGERERLSLLARAETAEAERAALVSRLASLETDRKSVQARADAASDEKASLAAQARAADTERTSLAGRIEELQRERVALDKALKRAEESARSKDTDLAVLTRSVGDLERSLARATDQADARATELQQRAQVQVEVETKARALEAERDNLSRQLELAIAEREGARQLSVRVEAELDLTRRRLTTHEEQLASKIEEASRLSAQTQIARERLEHQETLLAQSQSRAEELSATAAQSAEQGRILTEVALDRDRLREELGRRSGQIQKLEERLWETREEVQKERLENVRIGGEVERLREQAERSRQVEAGQAKEVEELSAEVRTVELERANVQGLLRSREEEIARLRHDAEALATESGDLRALRDELAGRGRELTELSSKLEQARAREMDAVSAARRRKEQLAEAGVEMERLRRNAEENATTASSVQGELDVKSLEVEQMAASVSDLQAQLDMQRRGIADGDSARGELQRNLEQSASEKEALRRRLREREQEMEDLVGAHESSGVELFKLRRELEAAAQANEQLEEALGLHPGADGDGEAFEGKGWPTDALDETRRLRAQVAAQARRHSEQLAQREAAAAAPGAARERVRRLQLEIEVRAHEQERILTRLDAAEQKIWEMTDASDRNAARLAASLAQLEKHKEQLDETLDELEVTRKLLAAAQARALEQERLLASERAKLARAGVGPEPSGLTPGEIDGVDELFAELEVGTRTMVDLEAPNFPAPVANPRGSSEPAAPRPVQDRGSAEGSGAIKARAGPRIVVERIDSDEGWDTEVTAAPTSSADQDTVPRPKKRRRSARKS